MKILLVDDDIEFLNKFKIYVDDFCKDTFDNYEIIEFNTINQFILDGDIVFLDIDLNGLNSIDSVKKIKMYNKNVIIIFVTSRENLVFNAFKVQPFYFIVKNQLSLDLATAFTLLKKYYLNKHKYSFIENGRKKVIYLDDVLYLVCNDHITTIVTVNESFDFYKGLKEIIQGPVFQKYEIIVQIHRKHCVNLIHIDDLKNDQVKLDDNTILKISRNHKHIFYEKYHKFLKEYH